MVGNYDKTACLKMHEELVKRRSYPCGICTKVCPIGKDPPALQEQGDPEERDPGRNGTLAANPDAPEYKSWTHIRKYGVPKTREKSKDEE